MTTRLHNNSVMQSSVPTKSVDYTSHSSTATKRPFICLARLDECIYVDDDRNTTKNKTNKQVQYSVTLCEGEHCGQRVFGAVDSATRGDGNNYHETIRKCTTGKFLPPQPDKLSETDGEYVYIAWQEGSGQAPVIIGSGHHPRSSDLSAKKEDGVREIREFNGVVTTIDKDGNHIVENRGGPKQPDGTYANPDVATKTTMKANGDIETTTGGTTVTMGKDGSHKVDSASAEINASSSFKMQTSGVADIKSSGVMSVDGSIVKIAKGGPSGARIGDSVICTGVDSAGDSHTLMGVIIGGSVLNLIGG